MRPRFGQAVMELPSRRMLGRVVGLVVSPDPTVLLSGDGCVPGTRLDPSQWAAASYDPRAEAWLVPAPDLPPAA